VANDNNSSRATEALLDQLHGLTAEMFIAEIRKYKNGEMKVVDKDGNAYTIPVSPALLAQAAKFLKDNGVDRPRRPGNQTDRLAGELEQFEQEFGGNVVGFPQK
jgi:hypothetical protein